MDDVLLFQAACRVNRWRKWKHDCLLVDFSHEGVVSKNLPKVFAKYGGITVSDLDAMTLKDKMDAAFKAFFKDDKDIIARVTIKTVSTTISGYIVIAAIGTNGVCR